MTAINEIFIYLIQTALSLYLLAMLLRFLLQLVRADFYNPISQFLVKITNPLVVPVRRVLPGRRRHIWNSTNVENPALEILNITRCNGADY